VSSVNSMFSVSPAGAISESAKPAAMQAIEAASFQALSAIAAATAQSMGTAPTGPNQFLNDPNSPTGPTGTAGDHGPAPGGSPGGNTAPTNTSPVDNHPTTVPLTPTTAPTTTPTNPGGPGNTPPTPNTTPPVTTPTTNTSPHITPTGTVTDVTESEAATHQIGSFSLLDHVSIANPGGSTSYVSGSAIAVTATVPGGLPSTLTNPAFLSSLLTIAPDGTVGYDRGNFAFLGAGQSLTYAIAFDVKSGSDTLHLTLTLTVNGADEAPTIIIGPADSATGTVTDNTHATAADLQTHGTLSFKDPDVTDAHSVSVAVKSGPAIGAFLAGVLVDTTGSDPATSAAGDIGWIFAANKAYIQSLAAGETATEVFTITLNDGQGGTVSEDVAITVVGVNDPPTIVAGSTTPTGAITELAGKTNDTADKDQASGTIAFADPDLTDTHTITQAAPTFTWSGGSLTAAQQSALTEAGALTLVKADSTGTGFGSLAWTYKVTDAALDFLAKGETLTITYNVTIDDGHGGTVTQPVTMTVMRRRS
jgi:VCBS repeat-containing protein